MLIMTRNIVIDRNSNRIDNVAAMLSTALFGSCLHQFRCLSYQVRVAFDRGQDPRGGKVGSKRFLPKPAAMSAAKPWLWLLKSWPTQLPTTTLNGVRSTLR